MLIESEKDLSSFNTLALPSMAAYFSVARSDEDIRAAINFARERGLPVGILGGGSNAILPERLEGLVIQPKIKAYACVEENANQVCVRVGAGENWHQVVHRSVHRGYFGAENLALIPGDVGAAPIQNIGAYGVELKDLMLRLTALDLRTLKSVDLSREQCQFGYRDSIFKREAKGRYVIVDITLRFYKHRQPTVSYPALRAALEARGLKSSTAEEVMNTVIDIRRAKLPDPAVIPNAGSFFKNPVVSKQCWRVLRQRYPQLVAFDAPEGQKKIAAAWLIEQAGWKGREKYGLKVHPQHALVLTNPHHQGADSLIRLAENIQTDVIEKFEVQLEVEPQILALWHHR